MEKKRDAVLKIRWKDRGCLMIYLDSAATSFYRPDCVGENMIYALKHWGNSGRGVNEESLAAAREIYETRCLLCGMFGGDGPEQCVFTGNATEALNMALFGALHPEEEETHVITTAMEHNSVLRPLYMLEERGLKLTVLPADKEGRISLQEMEGAIRKNTRAIVCTHSSNLTGNVNDIHAIGELAFGRGLLLIVDGAQTAGLLPISMKKDHIDILCVSGHKGLMGPQGTGALCVRKGLALAPMKAGGTGVQTFSRKQPEEMPEALEAGTLNGHGIAGLHAALKWIQEKGMDTIYRREQALMRRFYEQVRKIPGIVIYGDFSDYERSPVVSLNVGDCDSGVISFRLSSEYHISTRAGGHCAPLMHRALGTGDQGAVRFSFSSFNTEEEIGLTVRALAKIAGGELDR